MQSASALEQHRKILGVLYVALSVLWALVALVIFAVFMAGILPASEGEERAAALVLGGALTGFFLVLALPGLIAGIGMLRRRAWSKVLTIIVAVLSLPNFPVGTALGIYAIWFWLQPNTRKLFFPREPEPRGPELGGPGIRRPLIT